MSNFAVDPATDGFTAGGATNHGTLVRFERGNARKLPAVVKSKLDELFPAVDPGHKAVGTRVMVQRKKSRTVTKGGIQLTQESQAADQLSTPYAKVVSIGSGAFIQSGQKFTPDYAVGDYVRVPRWSGDELQVDGVYFTFYNWWDVIGLVDPELLAT